MAKQDESSPGFHRPFAAMAKRVAVASERQKGTGVAPKGAMKATEPVHAAAAEPQAEAIEAAAIVDEDALFAAEMRDVAPADLATDEYLVPRRRPVGTVPRRQPEADDAVMAQLESLVEHGWGFDLSFTDEHVEGLAQGVDRRLLKRLKKGEFAPEGHLDLHGKTRKEAKELVERLIKDSQKSGFRCVLMIHGRGLHSKDRVPVLKDALGLWLLRGRIARSVLAFCSARPADGGLGAVYVLLRR